MLEKFILILAAFWAKNIGCKATGSAAVCEILRLQPSTKKIPIIFMSALSSDVTRRTAAMQADDFFTKPLDLDRLQHRIANLLQREPLPAK